MPAADCGTDRALVERLVWRFGNGEVWITEGKNDVRRGEPADAVDRGDGAGAVSEPPPPACFAPRSDVPPRVAA